MPLAPVSWGELIDDKSSSEVGSLLKVSQGMVIAGREVSGKPGVRASERVSRG